MPIPRWRELARTPPLAQRNRAWVFLARCTGSSERGSNGSRDLLSLYRHPASELDHRIGRLGFPPGLGVIENGLVRPEFAGDGASRLVKRGPEFIAGGVWVE